jgi:hypothetical protein
MYKRWIRPGKKLLFLKAKNRFCCIICFIDPDPDDKTSKPGNGFKQLVRTMPEP